MALVRAATFSPVNQADTFEIQRQKINALAVDVDAGLIDGRQYPYIYSIEFVRQSENITSMDTGHGVICVGGEGYQKCLIQYDVDLDMYVANSTPDGAANFAAAKAATPNVLRGKYGIHTQAATIFSKDYNAPNGAFFILDKSAGTNFVVKFATSPKLGSSIPNLVTHTYSMANRSNANIVCREGDFGPAWFEDGGGNDVPGYRLVNNNAYAFSLGINALLGAKGQVAVYIVVNPCVEKILGYAFETLISLPAFSAVTIS